MAHYTRWIRTITVYINKWVGICDSFLLNSVPNFAQYLKIANALHPYGFKIRETPPRSHFVFGISVICIYPNPINVYDGYITLGRILLRI